jgi:hypothetical protein
MPLVFKRLKGLWIKGNTRTMLKTQNADGVAGTVKSGAIYTQTISPRTVNQSLAFNITSTRNPAIRTLSG